MDNHAHCIIISLLGVDVDFATQNDRWPQLHGETDMADFLVSLQ